MTVMITIPNIASNPGVRAGPLAVAGNEILAVAGNEIKAVRCQV
jgi:hypothetical protein